ncbi:hypothetical protein E6H36_03275 [Candidatus Bathyarchaeota archaeon]|nr:MAG: hypothetical protein E6H36_03275 [Candidatus Bathyarchaeota archaeon]TMI31804.1 MAG: hypothetical protein E6H29_03580 [Candidatus Bathyarchaeota archaeon]
MSQRTLNSLPEESKSQWVKCYKCGAWVHRRKCLTRHTSSALTIMPRGKLGVSRVVMEDSVAPGMAYYEEVSKRGRLAQTVECYCCVSHLAERKGDVG